MITFERAVFGNHRGSHQLLHSSLPTSDSVLDRIRFLVDRPAGHVGPEITWSPYWGFQRVGPWWVLWRGEEDKDAPRRNMVTARVALIQADQCEKVDILDELFALVGGVSELEKAPMARLAGVVANCIANQDGPAIVAEISVAPLVLAALWPRLWPSARCALSLRTLFGVEALETVARSSIVVIPADLTHRWHGQRLIDPNGDPGGLAMRWFIGQASIHERRIVEKNKKRLPGELTALNRIERIVQCLTSLHTRTATVTDALTVIRTQEAFDDGFVLGPDDQEVVTSALKKFRHATVADVRAASLVRLDATTRSRDVETALAGWIEKSLPVQSTEDALWILEKQRGEVHASWWRRAVGMGVRAACLERHRAWATAIWRWWQARPDNVDLTTNHMSPSHQIEHWLASSAPDNVDDKLLNALAPVCNEWNWGTLFARALGTHRPLITCVNFLRESLSHFEVAVDALLLDRDEVEVVDTATATLWQPLLSRAASYTIAKPLLLFETLTARGFLPLLMIHLSQGGELPAELLTVNFVLKVFDGVIQENADYLKVLKHLDKKAGRFALEHPQRERLLSCVTPKLLQGAAEEWWTRFLSADEVASPFTPLSPYVCQLAGINLDGANIGLVIRFLRLVPEFPEADYITWMNDKGFRWDTGDHQRMASLLLDRKWQAAATKFRSSWKRELKIVAWYARDSLFGVDEFLQPPDRAELPKGSVPRPQNPIVLLFLASNPLVSERLALDEEAREIGNKVRDSKHRDLVTIKTHLAVRPDDLQRALLDHQPTIVHFSGHGDSSGIALHSPDQANEQIVDTEALAELFGLFKDEIRMVVLNACHSEAQAKAIVKKIDFVVGMSESIGDNAARIFAAAFYRGLSFGHSVKKAFKLGINELKLVGLADEAVVPTLFVRQDVDAKNYYLVREH